MIYPSNQGDGERCGFCGAPLPPGVTQCAACQAQRAPRSSGNGCLIAVGVGALALFLLTVVVSGALVMMRMRHRTRSENEVAPPQTAAPVARAVDPVSPRPAHQSGSVISWAGSGSGEICLADANDDGTPDVIGYGTSLMALDGKNGGILWDAGGSLEHQKLYCDGGRRIVKVQDTDFSFSGLDPHSGKTLWSGKLDDAVESVAFGEGCVVIRATDGKSRELDSRTGAAKACSAKKPPKRSFMQRNKARAEGVEVEADKSSGAGTPRLKVHASGAAHWETTVEKIEAGHVQFVAASKHGVYVAGKKHGGAGMVVARLDLHSGRILATREEAHAHDPGPFMEITATHGMVLVESFGMLHVYEPEKLERSWWAGTMWAER